MKRLMILMAVMLLLSAVAVYAQESGVYDWARGISGSSIWSSLVVKGTGSDTSTVFYFNQLVPYGSVRFKKTNFRSTGDSIYDPKITYKYVDKDGKWLGDSIGAWLPFLSAGAETLKYAITAGDTIRHLKSYDFRTTGAEGVVFKAKGTVTFDSMKLWIGVIGTKKNAFGAYPPIW